jgi:hypothetical protein
VQQAPFFYNKMLVSQAIVFCTSRRGNTAVDPRNDKADIRDN